jgi:hypothetical protein
MPWRCPDVIGFNDIFNLLSLLILTFILLMHIMRYTIQFKEAQNAPDCQNICHWPQSSSAPAAGIPL